MLGEFAYQQSFGINALPRGGNTWPNNYAWDGYSDPEIQLYDKNKALRMPALGSTLGIGRRDTIEAPYIQYEANTDRDLGYPFDSPYQLVIPKWRFNNSKWLSFKDHRTNSSQIIYLPYTNEFVDEKMCSQFNITSFNYKCNFLGNNLYLHYPDNEGRIYRSFDNFYDSTRGNRSNFFYSFCERIRVQLYEIYRNSVFSDPNLSYSCVDSMLMYGKFSYRFSSSTSPLRTLEVGCNSDISMGNIVPIPILINFRKGSFNTPEIGKTIIFPNPAGNSATVVLSDFDPQLNYYVEVLDLKGVKQSQYVLKSNKSVLNLDSLSSGIYSVHLRASDGSLSQRFKLTIIK